MITYTELQYILIDGKNTSEVLRDLRSLFKSGGIYQNEIRKAEIKINRKHPKKYPLRLSGPNITIKLSNVSIGDQSVQSRGTLKALEIAGFYIPERIRRAVFTSKVFTYYFFKQESAAE